MKAPDTRALAAGDIVRSPIVCWSHGTVLMVHGDYAWVLWQPSPQPITHPIRQLEVIEGVP